MSNSSVSRRPGAGKWTERLFVITKVVLGVAMALSFLASSFGPGGWLEHLFGFH